MKKLRSFISKLSKKTKVIAGSFAALAALAVPVAAYAGYGPNGADRVIYDFSNPAQREGAFDAPRFNSYINTNVYGDERAFVDAKECIVAGPNCFVQGQSGGYADKQAVAPGKEYIIRAYVHNIANPSINDNSATPAPQDGVGVAKNARIRFELPAGDGIANGFTAQARITADNSIPKEVYDTVDLMNTTQKVGVSYIPGSAFIYNANHPTGLNLSDNIMGANGTLLGENTMDGTYPGCFEFTAFVVIRVRVTAPDLEIQKLASTVSMPTMADTAESVTVKRGENVSWRINYKNSGTHFASAVTVRDQLPAGLTIVPGSIVLTTARGNETLPDTALGSGGVNVGDYVPQGNGVIRFTTKVNTPPEVCELTNVAFVRNATIPERSDNAKVVISDCAPVKPIYSCDALTLSATTLKVGDKVKVTARYTAAGGATFKNAVFNFGDNATFATNNSSNNTVVAEHAYAAAGSYGIGVKLDFTVAGQTKTVEGGNCVAQLKVTTTTPPTTIPDTGTGSMIALFASVATAGAFVHNMLARRNARG